MDRVEEYIHKADRLSTAGPSDIWNVICPGRIQTRANRNRAVEPGISDQPIVLFPIAIVRSALFNQPIYIQHVVLSFNLKLSESGFLGLQRKILIGEGFFNGLWPNCGLYGYMRK